jgi:hypothetical protein
MKYFPDGIKTLEALKVEYRRLAMLHHPDRGGSVAAMQAVNAEYTRLFDSLATDETEERSDEYPDIVQAIIHLPGLIIELIGNWIWVTGPTYPVRDALKAAGLRWSKGKTAWYWHPEGYRRRGGRRFDLDEIRSMHGSTPIQGSPYKAVG